MNLFSQPPLEVLKKERDTIILRVETASGVPFNVAARKFIVDYLREHGPTSGEDITNACKEAGIVPPKDDRAFGGAFLSLSKRRIIVKDGTCIRKKGHLTSGGILWALNTPKNG